MRKCLKNPLLPSFFVRCETTTTCMVSLSDANRVKRVMAERRAGDPAELVSANRRILETLEWTPHYQDIDTIVGDALAWERKLPLPSAN